MFNYNCKQPLQEALSGYSQYVGMGSLVGLRQVIDCNAIIRIGYGCFYVKIRGLLFKFVDFLYSRSELFDGVIKVTSSENIFFSLSFDV